MKIAFEWQTMSTMKQLLWILITDSPKFHEPLAECLAIFSGTGRGCALPMAVCFLDFGHGWLTLIHLRMSIWTILRLPIFLGSWKWIYFWVHNSWTRQYYYMYCIYTHLKKKTMLITTGPHFLRGGGRCPFFPTMKNLNFSTTASCARNSIPFLGMQPPAAQLLSQPSEDDRKFQVILEDVWKKNNPIHPRKLSWNLKMMVFHRNLLF